MISIDKEKFTKMLEICNSISVADSPEGKPQSLRPLHAYVELKVENDKLKMTVSRENIDGYFYYEPEEIKDEVEGSKIVVQTIELLKLIRSRYAGIITLDKDKDENLIIKQGSFKAKLRLYNDDMFSDLVFDADWKPMPKNVVEDLKACSVVSDTQTVLMDIKGEEISLFAYTPVQLYYSLIELKDGKKDETDVGRKILAMNTVKTITSCFEKVDDLEFSYKEDDEKFYIKSSIGSARFGLLYDDMPMHYKDNVSISGLNKVKLDRKALLFVIESISQVLASWDQLVLVTVSVEQKMVHLKVVNNDLPAEARESLAIEETDLTDNFSIGIPSASVIKCLRNLEDSHIEMYFSSSDKPVFIKGCESDFSVGFMPFRI